jgi:hypothetical protein
MPITEDEMIIPADEYVVKEELIFLEKSEQPSSENGEGIPRGTLILTNKCLFFFSSGYGILQNDSNSLDLLKKSLDIASVFIPVDGIADIGQKGIELGEHIKIKNLNDKFESVETLLSNENTFVIPLDSIKEYKKFGKYWASRWLNTYKKHYSLGKVNYRNNYLRIGIEQNSDYQISYYCVYSINPKVPDDPRHLVNYNKWFDKIADVKNNN